MADWRGAFPPLGPQPPSAPSPFVNLVPHPSGSLGLPPFLPPGGVLHPSLVGEAAKAAVASTKVKQACLPCKRAHTACDDGRPCKKCVELGRVDQCVDVERKKPGRPKKNHSAQQPSATATSAATAVTTATAASATATVPGNSSASGADSSGVGNSSSAAAPPAAAAAAPQNGGGKQQDQPARKRARTESPVQGSPPQQQQQSQQQQPKPIAPGLAQPFFQQQHIMSAMAAGTTASSMPMHGANEKDLLSSAVSFLFQQVQSLTSTVETLRQEVTLLKSQQQQQQQQQQPRHQPSCAPPTAATSTSSSSSSSSSGSASLAAAATASSQPSELSLLSSSSSSSVLPSAGNTSSSSLSSGPSMMASLYAHHPYPWQPSPSPSQSTSSSTSASWSSWSSSSSSLSSSLSSPWPPSMPSPFFAGASASSSASPPPYAMMMAAGLRTDPSSSSSSSSPPPLGASVSPLDSPSPSSLASSSSLTSSPMPLGSAATAHAMTVTGPAGTLLRGSPPDDRMYIMISDLPRYAPMMEHFPFLLAFDLQSCSLPFVVDDLSKPWGVLRSPPGEADDTVPPVFYFANRALADLLLYSVDELVGHSVLGIYAPDDKTKIQLMPHVDDLPFSPIIPFSPLCIRKDGTIVRMATRLQCFSTRRLTPDWTIVVVDGIEEIGATLGPTNMHIPDLPKWLGQNTTAFLRSVMSMAGKGRGAATIHELVPGSPSMAGSYIHRFPSAPQDLRSSGRRVLAPPTPSMMGHHHHSFYSYGQDAGREHREGHEERMPTPHTEDLNEMLTQLMPDYALLTGDYPSSPLEQPPPHARHPPHPHQQP